MYTGIVAAFETPEALLHALRELRRRGYRRLDAFTPHPVKGIEEAMGLRRSMLTWYVFPVGIFGAAFAYLVQLYCNAYDSPLNVGGRPLNSAPAFIPITFESGVLAASLGGCFVFLLLTGLPRLYTPVADVDGFERASIDRFFAGVDDRDPQFDVDELDRLLRDLGAVSVGRARRRPR